MAWRSLTALELTCLRSFIQAEVGSFGLVGIRAAWQMLSSNNWTQQIRLIAIGHTAKRIEEYLFDWILYGSVVVFCTTKWGVYEGTFIAFMVMMPLSAIVCLLYLSFYMWAKTDWLGLEALKSMREADEQGGFVARLAYRIARHGSIPAFFALSIYGDPFMTTVYLRRGAKTYGKLEARDRNIFWSSVIVSNAYWTLRWTILIELALYAWEALILPALRWVETF